MSFGTNVPAHGSPSGFSSTTQHLLYKGKPFISFDPMQATFTAHDHPDFELLLEDERQAKVITGEVQPLDAKETVWRDRCRSEISKKGTIGVIGHRGQQGVQGCAGEEPAQGWPSLQGAQGAPSLPSALGVRGTDCPGPGPCGPPGVPGVRGTDCPGPGPCGAQADTPIIVP